MIVRSIQTKIRSCLSRYPAVALVGSRQSGKTTLARLLSNSYFDMEQETDRLKLDLEWDNIVGSQRLVVLDEVQTHPDIFPRLRGAIDGDRKRFGRFLLLGSISPRLMTQVSESLAGRLSVVELTPLLLEELDAETAGDRLWLCGGYPDGGVLGDRAYPDWQRNYLSLLAQRDLPNWGFPARGRTTERLLRMLATNHGCEWNASQIGKSLGLSYHTVNHYLDYLEDAFLIRRLLPFHANIRKRLVKRPKVYWRDSGLLHATLNVADRDGLLNQSWVGASWEGYVIEQILGLLNTLEKVFNAWYLRTSDQKEIDLILEFGAELWAIEIKLTTAPSPADFKKINETADLINADKRVLVTRNREFVESDTQIACDLPGFVEYLSRL